MTFGSNCRIGAAFLLMLLLALAGRASAHSADKAQGTSESDAAPPSFTLTRIDQEHRTVIRFCGGPNGAVLLRNVAEEGQAAAEAELGRAYLYGICSLPIDSDQAAYWLLKGAEHHDVYAQENLAFMYETGQPIRKPYRTTKETGWFVAPGIPRDYVKALAWYRRCADQGDVQCQGELSAMYGLGLGMPKDRKKSYYWQLIAARSGQAFYKTGLSLQEKQLSPEEVAEMRALTETWRPMLEDDKAFQPADTTK